MQLGNVVLVCRSSSYSQEMTSTYLSDDSFELSHSHISEDSDSELSELPTVPTMVSPNKAHSPSKDLLQRTPTKQVFSNTINRLSVTPDGKSSLTSSPKVDLNISSFSPLRPSGSNQHLATLERGKELAKKTEELAKNIKIKTERNDKLERYKTTGGILGLVEELDKEAQQHGEDVIEAATGSSTPGPSKPGISEPPLPVRPPGKAVFTRPPSFITELYPPGWVDGGEERGEGGSVHSDLERHLMTQQNPDTLREVICNDWMKLCYRTKTCPRSIWQWLFQIMCRSCDHRLAKSAWRNLDSLVQLAVSRNEISSIYSPTLGDVVDILVELGADRDRLLETEESEAMEIDNQEISRETAPPLANLSSLLCYLSSCIMANNLYTVDEAVSLVFVLVQVALDPHFVGELIENQLMQCAAAVIQSIPEDHWKDAASVLVSKIAALSSHHHDMLYLTTFFGGGAWKRVKELQKMLAKECIESLVNRERGTEEEKCAQRQFQDCTFVLQVVRHLLSQHSSSVDYYKLYSVMCLLALYMHPSEMVWPSVEMRKQVATLLGILSSDKIRDHPNHPERGPVKDLVIRMKLEVGIQKVSTQKQQDLFSYTT